jgi:hypothetical protein
MRAFFNHILILACIGAIVLAHSCQKTVPAQDVISIHASSMRVSADGGSMDTLYADLPVNALAADRAVSFQASSGLFANGFDTMTVIANRTDIDKGKITAVLTWKASLRIGLDTIVAATNTIPQVIDTLTLNLIASAPDSISLTPSSFTALDTFGTQITIMGTLFNSKGGMVSQGTEILFSAADTASPYSSMGMFRPQISISNDTSQVSTIYSPGLVPHMTYILLKASVLGPNGNTIAPSASTLIYVP